MFGQEKPAVCSPSSRPKSPSSGQKEPDVEEDPLELAFQEVAKYLDILPPQAATALKGRSFLHFPGFFDLKSAVLRALERAYSGAGLFPEKTQFYTNFSSISLFFWVIRLLSL